MHLRILCIAVHKDYMDGFKMLKESVEVVEMETATGVITAQFTLAVEKIEGIKDRVSVFERGGRATVAHLVGIYRPMKRRFLNAVRV